MDLTCRPAHVFTYSGVLAHVLTFSAVRRTMAIGALETAGSMTWAPVTRWSSSADRHPRDRGS